MRVTAERRIIMDHRWAFEDVGVQELIPPGSSITFQIYIVIAESDPTE